MTGIATLKLIAAIATVVGLMMGFAERFRAPNVRITSDSPRYPSWLKWLGFLVGAVGALGYIAIDLISS